MIGKALDDETASRLPFFVVEVAVVFAVGRGIDRLEEMSLGHVGDQLDFPADLFADLAR